jgi:hypothetical protein
MVQQLDPELGGTFGVQPFLSNLTGTFGVISLVELVLAAPGVATAAVTQAQTLPAGTLVLAAAYTIRAKPAGFATLESLAQVREGAGNELVVDFQGMRTVERLRAPATISSLRPWAGTQFDSTSVIGREGLSSDVSFTEIQTERLLVELAESVTAAQLAAAGSASVLSPPADLELLVNGTRAWFNAGPAKPGGADDDPAAFGVTVDLTDAVRAALAAAPAGAESVDVEVVLRSSVPGQLTLQAALELQQTYDVVFPEGDTRVVDADEEGVYTVLVPLPDDAADWQIHEVQAAVAAALPPARVLPPDGPQLSGDADIVLDADHAVLAGLPPASLALLAKLTAIRLPLGVGPEGAELAGVLRADADGSPGEPLPAGQLGPVTLPPGDLAQRTWATLPLAKEHKLGPGEQLWVGLQLARGRVSWPLAVPGPAQPPPALSTDAPLRRTLPNGLFRPLSSAGDVSTAAGAVRLVGEAPGSSPIPALELELVLDESGGAVGVPPFTPTTDGVPVAIRLDPPIARASAPAAFDASGALVLRLTTKTAGAVSIGQVRIAYTDGGQA